MIDSTKTNIKVALDTIQTSLGQTVANAILDECRDDDSIDEELILGIASACNRWLRRLGDNDNDG